MSTQSLLYHAFGLKDVDYLSTSYKGGKVYFDIQTKDEKLCCSSCGSRDVVKKGVLKRTFRIVPIGTKEVFIVAHIRRLRCKSCGLVRQEHISYADQKKAIPGS